MEADWGFLIAISNSLFRTFSFGVKQSEVVYSSFDAAIIYGQIGFEHVVNVLGQRYLTKQIVLDGAHYVKRSSAFQNGDMLNAYLGSNPKDTMYVQ